MSATSDEHNMYGEERRGKDRQLTCSFAQILHYLDLSNVHELAQINLPPSLGILLRAIAFAVVVARAIAIHRHPGAESVIHAALSRGAAYRQVCRTHVQARHQLILTRDRV